MDIVWAKQPERRKKKKKEGVPSTEIHQTHPEQLDHYRNQHIDMYEVPSLLKIGDG